mmetsp:Transcript_3841/g.9143  ORF Transcript_3841/g.9143 Transcript_3841/m.9143 type:complete len:207 (+) Transcript_3841:454-1074(+)
MATTPKRNMLRMISWKAFLADVQKLVPIRATWMYAFLLRNLMSFSKHQMQQARMQKISCRTRFLLAFACSERKRMNHFSHCTMARIREPKAKLPKCQKTAFVNAGQNTNVEAFSSCLAKNQAPAAPAMRHWQTASSRALCHSSANRAYQNCQPIVYRGAAHRQQRGTEVTLSGTHVATSSYAKPGGTMFVQAPGVVAFPAASGSVA